MGGSSGGKDIVVHYKMKWNAGKKSFGLSPARIVTERVLARDHHSLAARPANEIKVRRAAHQRAGFLFGLLGTTTRVL